MMQVLVADDPVLGRVQYTDRKRWAWLLSVLWPLLPFTGIAAHALSGYEIGLGLPLLLGYGLLPLLDALVGEDRNNPPEAVVPQLDADRYYRWLTWITVPLHFVALIGCAWWAGTQDAVVVGPAAAGLRGRCQFGPGPEHRARAGPQAQRPSSSGWRAWCWPCRRTATSRSSTAAGTTAGWLDAGRPRQLAHGRERSTASRCASCRAASEARLARWKAPAAGRSRATRSGQPAQHDAGSRTPSALLLQARAGGRLRLR